VNADPPGRAGDNDDTGKRAERLQVFKVTGVVKEDGRDEQITIEALSEANARVKAELRGIIVTSVVVTETRMPDDVQQEPKVSKASPAMTETQADAFNKRSENFKQRGNLRDRLAGGFIAVGWVLFAIGLLSGLSGWVSPFHLRDTAVKEMLDGDSWALGSALAFLIGFSIISVLSLLLGFSAYILSKRQRGSGLIVASLLCILFTMAGQLRPSRGDARDWPKTDAIRKTGEELSLIYESAAPSPGNMPRPPEKSHSSTGVPEADFIVELNRQLVAGIMEDTAEYQRAVIALRIDSVLLPVRVDSVSKINESKANLAAALNAFANYESAFWKRVSKAQDAIRTAPLAADTRAAMLASFNKGLSNSIARTETTFNYEREMYVELNALLDFLAAKQGQFHFKNGQLLFEDDADVLEYNTSFNRYLAIAAKQATMRERGQGNLRTYAEKLSVADKPEDFRYRDGAALTRNWTVDLSESGFLLNKTKINLPTTVEAITSAMGKPSRVLAKSNTIHVWDTLGMFSYSKPGSSVIDSIAICFNSHDGLDYYPTNQFVGTMTLCKLRVSDIDTPHSLNRKLPNETFERLDPWGRIWNLRLPTIVVGMGIEKSGLTDWITIRGFRSAQDQEQLTRQSQDVFDKIAEELKTPRFSGTGFFVTESGHILTSLHVVNNAKKLLVLHGGQRVTAILVSSNKQHDLALLKADLASKPLAIGSSASVKLGQGVFTVGFPNIELQGRDPKLTKGEISSLRGLMDDANSLQVSVPVQPGNSGGPLMMLDGTVVGLVQARLEPLETLLLTGSMPQNVNYAVKSDLIRKFLDSTKETKGKLRSSAIGDNRNFEAVVEKATESTVLVLAF